MKYALAFLLVGILVSYLGMTLGRWWNLLHWFSISCFTLSTGYAGLGPRVFGKRPDGRIPIWSKIIHFPYLLYSSAIWQLVRVLSRENPTDRISEDLILGRRLDSGELPPGVSSCVDLTAEFEDPEEIRKSTRYISLPILDAGVPSPVDLHSTISELPPGLTLVHCAQGHGRTGLFALALLADRGRIRSYEEGLTLIKRARPGIRLNGTQEQFIRKYIEEYGAGEAE